MGEHATTASGLGRGGWHGRGVRLGVVAALAVAAGCAALLVSARAGTDRSSASADCGTTCVAQGSGRPTAGSTAGPAAGAGQTPTAPEQHSSSPLPASSAAPPAAASSAPISASALVQFKVTSHWDDGYRAAVTITNTGAAPLTGWHLAFHVAGATLHQPTDTGETAMRGDVVTVTPASWHPTLAAGGTATFGFGFDGTLAAPAGCELDGKPCVLTYVAAAPGQ